MDSKKTNSLPSLSGAIIIAGALIAIAIVWTNKPAASANSQLAAPAAPVQASVSAVTSADHILGDPSAPIKIVEYSDPSCPYCKMFNPIMEQVISQYGPTGQVAWIYRHFPLDKPDSSGNVLHPNASHEAEGFECAASLGGNTAFWAYEKEWFTVIPDNGADRPVSADTAQLDQVAKDIGLDTTAFDACVSGDRFKTAIDNQYLGGLNAGVQGTPSSFIITQSGTTIPLVGSEDYSTMKQAIDTLLAGGGPSQ